MRFEASQSALVRQIKRATLTSYTSDFETAELHKGELRSGVNIFSRYAKYNYGQCIGVPLRAMMAYQRRVTVKLDASLNLDTTWRYVISFIPRSHYPLPPRERAQSAHCKRGWAGTSAGLEAFKYKNLLYLPRIKVRFLGGIAHSFVTTMNELTRLIPTSVTCHISR